jgi:hypothetical protein
MAFHPFRMFRKHQKVIWGFLVIVCMITFVLMSGSGRGDIFDRITHWVRSSKGGTPVTTLYGRTVDTRQLDEVRRESEMAQRVIGTALRLAHEQIQRDLGPLQEQMKNKQFDPKGGGFEQLRKQMDLQQQQQDLQSQQFKALFEFQGREKAEGQLDVLLWRQQADRLGIQFTNEDIDAQFKQYTKGRIGVTDVLAELNRSSRQPLSADTLFTVLGNEFRVTTAQEALLNYEPEVPDFFGMRSTPSTKQVPAPVTPYEFWTHYQKERTALDVALVKVPVDVPSGAAPDEQDMKQIRAMYNRYKDQEPRPDQAQPGFKVPRRIKVGWVKADPGSEHYEKAAGETLQVLRFGLAKAAAGHAILTGLPFVADPYFLNEYYTLKATGHFDMAPLTQADYPLSLYATRVRPENVASAFGDATAATAQGTPLGAFALYQAGLVKANAKDMEPLVQEEAKNRIPFGCSLLLAGAGSGTLAPLSATATAAGLVAHGDRTTQSLPLATVQDEVLGRARATLARDLATGNLKAFQKEMETQRAKGGTKDARNKAVEEWLPKALEEYHLEGAAKPMEEARDQYTIAGDPALQPLREALLRQPGQNPARADEEFAALFKDQGPEGRTAQGEYNPTTWPPNASLGDQFRPPDPDVFLVWRTEEKPAYVPAKSFDEIEDQKVKDQVVAAWRLGKARRKAEEKADQLKEELAKTGGEQASVRQTAAQNGFEVIELTKVARQVPEDVAIATGHRYQPFHFPEAIRYPGKDWVDQMLDHLKVRGDTLVLRDQPEKTFYVAVLLDRHEPSLRTFADVYKDAAVSLSRDQLLDQFVQEKRTKYREEFLKALRVEATPDKYKEEVAKTGKYHLDDEYTKIQEKRRAGGQEEGEE